MDVIPMQVAPLLVTVILKIFLLLSHCVLENQSLW